MSQRTGIIHWFERGWYHLEAGIGSVMSGYGVGYVHVRASCCHLLPCELPTNECTIQRHI